MSEYERAAAAERMAWFWARDVVGDETGSGAWEAWRDAVERTQQATRSLVNYQTGDSFRSRPGRGGEKLRALRR